MSDVSTTRKNIPENLRQGVGRLGELVASRVAHTIFKNENPKVPPVPFEEGVWQVRALDAIIKGIFPSTVKLDKQKDNGYYAGFCLSKIQLLLVPEVAAKGRLLEGTALKDKIEGMKNSGMVESEAGKLRELQQTLNHKELISFAKGYEKGISEVVIEHQESSRYSERIKAYTVMLLFEDQLHFFPTWRDFHVMIGKQVPSYASSDRFEACRSMARDVGYSPSADL